MGQNTKSGLSIALPSGALPERAYVISFVVGDILGVPYVLSENDRQEYCIKDGGKYIELPDLFLSSADYSSRSSAVLPKVPLQAFHWERRDSGNYRQRDEPLPVLFGSPHLELGEKHVRCNIDILGSIFFMLSGYEEVVLNIRDEHGRFPGRASIASKAEYLARPLVDEYVELLWRMLKHLWPGLERKRRQGDVFVTCDVDRPFDCKRSSTRTFMRAVGGDLLKRRNLRLTAKRISAFVSHRTGNHKSDENYTFDWYMDMCAAAGRRVTFFFIPDRSTRRMDGCYRLEDRSILTLIRKIYDRGHDLGVHGSYNSYMDRSRIMAERNRMIQACERAAVHAQLRGNRQHYLRWDVTQTPDYLDAAGYSYDTTGGYADVPGFRYGTSRPFKMWSWQKRAPLHIEQRPLVLMEGTVLASHHMAMGYTEETLGLMCKLKERALSYGGDFTLLWHNSHLKTMKDREFFEELIR